MTNPNEMQMTNTIIATHFSDDPANAVRAHAAICEIFERIGGMPAAEWLAKLENLISDMPINGTQVLEILKCAETRILPAASEANSITFERALFELVDKIVPGRDTGDLLADAKYASRVLDEDASEAGAVPKSLAARVIDLLERNKPRYGAIGSRDVDVANAVRDFDAVIADLRASPPAPVEAGAAAQAIATLKSLMQADPDLAWTWHCGIWSASYDEGVDTNIANRAAARVMQMAFGVDTSKHENFAATQGAPSDAPAQQKNRERVFWPLTHAGAVALANEITLGATTMGGPDDDGETADLILEVRPAGTVANDDGELNPSPILAISLAEYPDEGVYPIDPLDPTEGSKDEAPAPAAQGDERAAFEHALLAYMLEKNPGRTLTLIDIEGWRATGEYGSRPVIHGMWAGWKFARSALSHQPSAPASVHPDSADLIRLGGLLVDVARKLLAQDHAVLTFADRMALKGLSDAYLDARAALAATKPEGVNHGE